MDPIKKMVDLVDHNPLLPKYKERLLIGRYQPLIVWDAALTLSLEAEPSWKASGRSHQPVQTGGTSQPRNIVVFIPFRDQMTA
jgi:hypothetical protein